MLGRMNNTPSAATICSLRRTTVLDGHPRSERCGPHLCGLSDAAADPQGFVPLVRRPHPGGAKKLRLTTVRKSGDYPVQPLPRGEPTVLADVGGTNIRFALVVDGVRGEIAYRQIADYASFADAFGDFLSRHAMGIRIAAAEFAVAGVVDGERCRLTNGGWTIDGRELRAKFGLARVGLVNDFEAIAYALPHLGKAGLCPLGNGRQPVAGAPMAVVGPGTGLGVAALVSNCGQRIVIASEAGHTTLPAASTREALIITHLRRRFGHVSAERALSGPGLENLYLAIAALSKTSPPPRTATEITKAAVAGICPTSTEALEMFCAMLGTVAGNVALSFGARGGFFIAGGIVPHLGDFLARSQFRERFEGKGRLRPYLEGIPVYVVLNTDAAFFGLQSLAAGSRAAN